jgi:hypothetical protein
MAIFTPVGGQAAALSSIKAGAYPCEIVGAVEKVSKDGQFSQHSLRARVFDEANDDWEDFWELLTFSPKAQWKLEEVMQALGIGFSVGVAVQVEAGDWLGKTGRLVLKEEIEQGQKRLRIGRWLPREGAPVEKARLAGHGAEGGVDADRLPF